MAAVVSLLLLVAYCRRCRRLFASSCRLAPILIARHRPLPPLALLLSLLNRVCSVVLRLVFSPVLSFLAGVFLELLVFFESSLLAVDFVLGYLALAKLSPVIEQALTP